MTIRVFRNAGFDKHCTGSHWLTRMALIFGVKKMWWLIILLVLIPALYDALGETIRQRERDTEDLD